jgi:hypothetical protein
MRGLSVLIAYLLVLGAIITFGIASLMALQPSTKPTPSASAAAVAHKGQAAQPDKQTTQKDVQPNQKRKTVKATRKRMEEAPTNRSSGLDAYGSADKPRHFYPNPFRFFGRWRPYP